MPRGDARKALPGALLCVLGAVGWLAWTTWELRLDVASRAWPTGLGFLAVGVLVTRAALRQK